MGASLRRLLAITRKELRHITRDFRIFFLVTLSPAFLLVILAYLFSFDVGTVRVAWLDLDQSGASRDYRRSLTADGTFVVSGAPAGYDEIDRALLNGRADLALVVRPGFERGLISGRGAEVQAVVDGADALTASSALAGVAARTNAFGQRQQGGGGLLDIASRVWYNPGLKSQWSMAPGLLAIVLTLPALALTLAVSREQEVGTLEALIATPLTGAEYLLGKLAAYLASGLISALLAAGAAVFWFEVPFRGSLAVYLLLAAGFFLACMGLSLFIAQVVSSQQTAMLTVLLIFFVPGFFIAGLISPPRTSSLPSLLISTALPATHFIVIARAVFLKGAGLASLQGHALILFAFGAVSTLLSMLRFRKQVA